MAILSYYPVMLLKAPYREEKKKKKNSPGLNSHPEREKEQTEEEQYGLEGLSSLPAELQTHIALFFIPL